MIKRRSMIVATGLSAIALLASACTVQPLYAPSGSVAGKPLVGKVEIAPADTRLEQQVREAMLFRIGGGDATASDPLYRVTLSVTGQSTGVFTVRNADGINRSRSGQFVTTGTMALYDLSTGQLISTERRSAISEFDRSRQEFAAERAELDASNRAARELGEQLYLVLVARIANNPF